MHPQDTIVNLNVNNKNAKNQDSDKNILSPEMHDVVSALQQRQFNICPAHIKITGSVISGYLLSQLIFINRYYLEQGKDKFYKTDDWLRNHLVIGEHEFKAAKKNLIELGFISVDKVGFPAKSHYQVLTKNINNAIFDSLKKVEKPSEPPNNHSQVISAQLEEKKDIPQSSDCSRLVKTACQSGDFRPTDYMNDLKNDLSKNNNNSSTEASRGNSDGLLKPESNVVVSFEKRDDEEDHLLKKELVDIGLSSFDAVRMAAKHGSYKIREKLKMMPPESKIKSSRAAWLRSAIERDYPPPENVPTAKILSQEDTERRLKAQADAAEIEHAKFMIDCALAQNNPAAAQVWKDFLSARP